MLTGVAACTNQNNDELERLQREVEELRAGNETLNSESITTPESPSNKSPSDELPSNETSGDNGSNSLRGGQETRIPIEIVESGYGFATWSTSRLSYALTLYNPNDETLEFPSYRVTARRADNTIIGTDDRVLNIIYPGQRLTVADIPSFDVVPSEVYIVEFEILEPRDWNWKAGEVFIEFEPINLSLVRDSRGDYKVTGEIYNLNDISYDTIRLDLVIRDLNGNIVGGDSTFIRNISANGSVAFEIDVRSSILQNIDGEWDVEIYASPW
jgi:hypothetical protein